MPDTPQTTDRDGLHCVHDRCIGPPRGPVCDARCSFTMRTLPAIFDIPNYMPCPACVRLPSGVFRCDHGAACAHVEATTHV